MPSDPVLVLGIETSCDETAVAIVSDARTIVAERIFSQLDDHRPFGGVVPEVAARAHLKHLDRLIAQTMGEARLDFSSLAAIAATGGPGLIGGVIVGVMTAKAIAAVHRLPFLAINHLEGHALSMRLSGGVDFPYLLLLVSGGHCQLLVVEGVANYRRLGTTLDDALGEAYDKIAKMLGLGYPGGPAVEARARGGNPDRFALPRPMKGRAGCDFSFSGLKTAVKHAWQALPQGEGLQGEAKDRAIADLCASFQAAAGDVLVDRTAQALDAVAELHRGTAVEAIPLVVAGGVAANGYLRGRLSAMAEDRGIRLLAPPQRLCTDNGAMIAWAGIERLRLGLVDRLDFAPRPRWPLDPNAAPAAFAGVKA